MKNSTILVIGIIVSSLLSIVFMISFCVFLIKKFNLIQEIVTYYQSNNYVINVIWTIFSILGGGIVIYFREKVKELLCIFFLFIPRLCIEFFIKKTLKILSYDKSGISIDNNAVQDSIIFLAFIFYLLGFQKINLTTRSTSNPNSRSNSYTLFIKGDIRKELNINSLLYLRRFNQTILFYIKGDKTK